MNTYLYKLIRLVKKNEPVLSGQEKIEMWHRIVRRSRRTVILRRVAAAACFAAAVGAGAFFGLRDNGHADLLASLQSLRLDSCRTTCIVVGDDCFEVAGNVNIAVNTVRREVSVEQFGDTFAVKYRDDDMLAVSVPCGNMSVVSLADGSTVTLRGGSQLLTAVGADTDGRGVALNGEAYLNVFHDEDHPFAVDTYLMDVRVLGTEFVVKSRRDDSNKTVTLINGRVEVVPANGNPVIMHPNQTFCYQANKRVATLRAERDAENSAAWKDGLLALDRQPLADVLRQIENIYNVKVSFDSADLGDIRLDGRLDVDVTVDELFKNLERIAPVHVKYDSNLYIVISTKR